MSKPASTKACTFLLEVYNNLFGFIELAVNSPQPLTLTSCNRIRRGRPYQFIVVDLFILAVFMKKLAVATLIYISAPSFLFTYFWLKPFYACICLVCLMTALLIALACITEQEEAISQKQEFRKIVISSSLISLIICLCSEFGAISYQSFDYIAHNYKLNLLATSELPLYSSTRDLHMCYYLGYYIIPALLGKYSSLAHVAICYFLWSWIGLSMTLAWIQYSVIHMNPVQRISVCVLVVAGSYVSIILPAVKWLIDEAPIQNGSTIVVQGKFLLNQIPALTRGLSESTQHTIPCILGISFLLGVWSRKGFFFPVLFFLLSTLFVSPFATIGLLPFVLILFIRRLLKNWKPFVRGLLLYSIPLVVAFLPVVLFLAGSKAIEMSSNGLIWQTGTSFWWLYYLLYLFSSYGIWIVLFKTDLFIFNRAAMLTSIAFMSLITFFQVGYYNDLHIRSTVVPQIVFGISISHVIVLNFRQVLRKRHLALGIAFWLLNTLAPVKFFYDRIFVLKGHRNTIAQPTLPGIKGDYYDILEQSYIGNGKEVVMQYSLQKNTIFEKYLLNRK